MMKLIELRTCMKSCPQTNTMNVLEHGRSVASYFIDLYNHARNEKELKYSWRLPEWIHDPKLWDNILDLKTILRYQIYHDCGKPFCLTEDKQGRHFINHAEWSYKIWKLCNQSEQEATLMKMDMDMHIMKSDDVEEFAKCKEAATLLITSLCEIHSNANMFGGIESTSFKIKWKKINKFGKRIINKLGETK